MNCPYCGKENPDGLEVCNYCGGHLLPAPGQPTQQAEPLEAMAEVVQDAAPAPDAGFTPLPPTPPPAGHIYGSKLWIIAGCAIFLFVALGCIAVVLGLYRYTKAQGFLDFTRGVPGNSPTQSEINPVLTSVSTLPTSEILFFDDFSDPNSGWDQVEETDYSTYYYSNSYRIVINSDLSDSWANPGDQNFEDVVVEARATKNGGPDDNDFGLICRYQDTEHFYYGIIASDGYYGISKVTPEDTQLLGHETLEYSDLINPGFATNTIRFECVGSTLTLYANGQLLDRQSDSDYSSGNVGLIAGTYNTPGTDILFDDFSVYRP